MTTFRVPRGRSKNTNSLSSDGKIASQIPGKSFFKGKGIQESINHCVLLLLSNLYRLEVSEGGIYLGMKQSELIISEFSWLEGIVRARNAWKQT